MALCLIALGSTACTDAAKAREALDSLRKVQTATQMGIGYEPYSSLTLDAKVKTEAALQELSDDALKSELRMAADSYADGVAFWTAALKGEHFDLSREPWRTLLPKYSIQIDQRGQVDTEAALHNIWQSASFHIAKSEALSEISWPYGHTSVD